MVRPPSYDSNGIKKGAWSEEEDNKLRAYIMRYGHWNWRLLPKYAGLARCGKSCRLRWVNYLKPGVKKGNFTKHEKDLIVELHAQLGNKWSAIAAKLPGRTDNDIKNYWHAHIDKRGKQDAATVIGSHTIYEANSMDTHQLCLKEEKPFENITFPEKNLNELASLDAVTNVQDSALSFDAESSDSINATPQGDFWPDSFLGYPVDDNQTDYFPPVLSEEVFFYPEYDYSDLSNSDSSNLGDLSTISSDHDYVAEPVHGDFWSEPFVLCTSNSQIENCYNVCPEDVGGLYDHCLPYSDRGMYLL
ncbi:hypothetical protein BUALT_Bualt03G0202400 [Buddleja alternifolia]|uniref:Uncharacterized protein n=1 Tax=Buddleja alternifolia TaxID=168488 RepID=A0AAV6XW68_9LAMI|nr:hypothetical protein BUALT_Bualt03G0202400 [Buddleja alternifolia]